MTEESDIPIEEVDRIERGKATRPWRLNETTVRDISRMSALHRDIDTAFVPWRAQEPVDEAEVLFTVDSRIVDTREDVTLEGVIEEVVEHVENDSNTSEYIVWEHIEPAAEVASIDESRSRVRVRWGVPGGDDD